MKQQLLKMLTLPGVANALAVLTGTHGTIFMLHRFTVPDLGISGHDSSALRRNLASLRKHRFTFLSVEDLILRLQNGDPVERAVAFTIDDGYFDHAEIAAPIFAEFDCPVTCFLATGFLDGKMWFWWDRLMYVIENTRRRELTARLGNREIKYRWFSRHARFRVWANLNLRCQDASEEDRLACIRDLSREAEVDLPDQPPARFAPMSWETARRLESKGVTFGPHTVTHPVLGTTSSSQAEFEIVESWRRLSAEVVHPVPVFCYPNGRAKDVGEREISSVRSLGLRAALMAHPGDLNPHELRRNKAAAYRIPRFGYVDDLPHLLQCVSGLENVKTRLSMKAAA